jgi:SAM-dependent methyltransferase
LQESVSLNRYWNRRLDPLDWKRVRDTTGRRRWRAAHRSFLSPETRDAIDLLGDLRGRRLLEIGCAQGFGALHLARLGARVTGIDVSDRRCAIADRALAETDAARRVQLCAARAERLPFADGSFERVFCRDVLMYADPRAVAAECARVLQPGGRVVFVESLAGPAVVRWYRRWTSPRDYRSFTRHLSWREIQGLGDPLELRTARPYHLLSIAAFLGLFVLRSRALWLLGLRLLQPVDVRLLRLFPGLAQVAWRATALYEKPQEAS